MVTEFLLLVLQIPEWIEGLKDPRTGVESARALAEASPQEVIPLLAQAIEADPGFAPGTNARQLAYQAASEARTVHGEGKERRRLVKLEAQVRLLERGTKESASGIRMLCTRSIGDWSQEWQDPALKLLAHALVDADPVVRIESCRSASHWRSAAEALMPQLELLLKGLGEDGKPLSWIRPGGLFPNTEDYEFWQRKEAALARMHIRSFDVDRGLFDHLDATGQDALCSAWALFGYVEILEHHRTSAESPTFLQVKENLDLLLRPLFRPYLLDEKDSALNEPVVLVLYHAHASGLLTQRHRETIRSQLTTLLSESHLAARQRQRLQLLQLELEK